MKIKNIGYLFLLLISLSIAITTWKNIFYVIQDAVLHRDDAGILLLAWPILLFMVILAVGSTALLIFSWKQLQNKPKVAVVSPVPNPPFQK